MKWRIAMALVLLTVAGCGQSGVPGGRDALQGAHPPKDATFATQLAGPGTYLPPMPTAVVVLRPEDMARNRAFCMAMTKLPTVQEAMSKSAVAPNLIFTRWLTQLSEVSFDKVRDCEFLAGTYDYARARSLIASIRASAPLTGRGPFLLLIVPDARGLQVVGIDGSGYDADDFDKLVASWGAAMGRSQDQIATGTTDQPGLVRSLSGLLSNALRTVFAPPAGLIQGTVAAL